MKRLSPRHGRSAFTLVEVLVVVAVIVLLVSITLGLVGPVRDSIRMTAAKTQRDKIVLALNDFKGAYGDYPMLDGGGSESAWSELLLDSMRGDKILVRKDGKIQVADYNDGRAGAEKRPFLALSEFTLDEDRIDSATEILDPWDNPYQYRYNKISSGSLGKNWNSPTFLLISAGALYDDPVSDDDYFVGTMEEDGMPSTDVNSNDYYFTDNRADNITNF
ncbi:MAG: prepilin-type N-terminal cleavage/methylation domain-containing protein [Opitutae bacterium]|nr:prepilin-type N-terminal cleavage/methylation domain-containing protein [Opitutae bacterium]